MLMGRSDLPLERDVSGRFLPWLVAVMVYLAALALVGTMAMNRVIERWDRGLSGHLTVQVPPPAADDGSDPVGTVLDRLLDTPGIRSAEVLEPDEISRLLEPWLGAVSTYEDLPLPALIAVTLDPDDPPDLERLAQAIERAAPGALVDDHQAWLGRLVELVRSIELVAALIVLLVGASAITMVVFATRAGLTVHARVIELLHLIGAQDEYVARQFQVHTLRLALRGGALGLVLAMVTVLGVGALLGRAETALLPGFALRAAEWSSLVLVPLVIAGAAMLTARWTVLRTLGRMP